MPIYMSKLYGRKILVFLDGALVAETITDNLAVYADVTEKGGSSSIYKEYVSGRMWWECSSGCLSLRVRDLSDLAGKTVEVIASASEAWSWEEINGVMLNGVATIVSVVADAACGSILKNRIKLSGIGNISDNEASGWFITSDNYKLLTSDGRRFVSQSQI